MSTDRIVAVLHDIHAGKLPPWSEDEADPWWLSEALRLGYVRRADGSGWNTTCSVELTKAGMERMGV